MADNPAGYLIAWRGTINRTGRVKLFADWDGEVHPTREAADEQVAAATASPDVHETYRVYELREVTDTPPARTIHTVERDNIDGLYLFEHEDQAAAYADLFEDAETGAAEVIGRATANRMIAEERADQEDELPAPHPARVGFTPTFGEYVMDDPIAEHDAGEHEEWPQPECCRACQMLEETS